MPSAGFEPATYTLEECRSIQLSYEGIYYFVTDLILPAALIVCQVYLVLKQSVISFLYGKLNLNNIRKAFLLIMKFKQPEDIYYSQTSKFIEVRANTVEDVVSSLMEDEDYRDEVQYENSDRELTIQKTLDEAVAELAPEMAVLMIEAHQKKITHWSQHGETDNVKLTRAFESLAPEIVAKEDYMCCGSCGSADLVDRFKAGEFPPEALGFVFYNEQATDNIAEGDYEAHLHFRYNSFNGEEDTTLIVANKLFQALENEGLAPEWDGATGNTISIKMIWKRVFPNWPSLISSTTV